MLTPDLLNYVSSQSQTTTKAATVVLDLLYNQDATVPFITRYRKEVTGGLDEVQIANIQKFYEEYLEREKRRAFILETIDKMDKLTPELKAKILKATSITLLEDIYAPYKLKRKTKGQMALEAGLLKLCEIIKTSGKDLKKIEEEHFKDFINKEHKIETFDQALEGVKAILSDELTHNVELKEKLRIDYAQQANLKSEKRKNAESVKDFDKYKDYFEFEQKIKELKDPKVSHRFLALRRGMLQEVLKVELIYDEESALNTIKSFCDFYSKSAAQDFIDKTIKHALRRIHTSLELEFKGELKSICDESAINVFGENLKNLLLQPYLGAKTVLGIDPGIRTGCKIALIDQSGKFLLDTVIYPHPPKSDKQGSLHVIKTLIEKFKLSYIAIGNGTFGRETLQFLKENIAEISSGKVKAVLVNEDGASIYSASEIARKEFPDKDPTVRGAISIARRFQDPLAELVKIDPKSIGVGQYQHDVNQIKLKRNLQGVVESCVNYVGVDLNTASAPLLSFVSGVGNSVASNIIKEREKSGGFKSRKELLQISRFTEKVFEQSAGFLRIYEGSEPLDATFIHPSELISQADLISKLEKDSSLKDKLGSFTHEDIVKSLRAPRQDPRDEFKSFDYKKGLSDIKGIKTGEYYPGIVTNITKFGAFVDIGIKENGLIHISEMADVFVDDPLKVLKVGQQVNAKAIELDLERKRIALSLKSDTKPVHKKPRQASKQEFKNNAFASLKNFKS